MEGQPRCKKCGRVLKSRASIARGMGSTCAGVITAGKTFRSTIAQNSGNAYPTAGAMTGKAGTYLGDLSSKPLSKREVFRRTRDERRRLFDSRQPFQCGVLSKGHIPLIYVPTGDAWKENHSGRIVPHDELFRYLKRYHFI